MSEDKYQKLITEALEYYKSSKKENIDEILFDFLNKQNVTENEKESKKVISNISDTFENISDFYDYIKNKRSDENNPEQPHQIIRENLKESLKDSQKDDQKKISETIIKKIEEISESKKNNEYNILESPVEYSEKLNSSINNLIGLDALTIDKLSSEIEIDLPEGNKNIDLSDFYNSDFNSEEEKNIKKTLSVASYIARKKKIIKLQNTDIEEKVIDESIPFIIDKTLSQSKIFYKYGKNEISIDKTFDEFIDRYIAILLSVVDISCKNIGQNIGSKVGSYIGSIFGPIGTSIGFEVGRQVGSIAGEEVGKIINTGIKKFSSFVKKSIKTVVETANKIYVNVKNELINLFV